MSTDQEQPQPQIATQPDTIKGPKANQTPPAETETSSKNTPDEPLETLQKQASSATIDENETAPKSSSLPPDHIANPETDEQKTLKDPKANQPPPDGTETSSQNTPMEPLDTLKNQASSATGADPNSSLPPDHVATPTPEPETETNERKESPDEITPANDETISKQSSQGKKDFAKTSSPRSKKIPLWEKLRIRHRLQSLIGKASQSKLDEADKSVDGKEMESPTKLIRAVSADIDSTQKGSETLDRYKANLNGLHDAIKKLEENDNQVPPGGELSKLKQDLIKLRLQTPLKYSRESNGAPGKFHFNSISKKIIPQDVLNMMPQLHKDSFFESSPEFKDFEARYNDLSLKLKLCLLCFSVFPENEIMKKSVIMKWWIVEGYASEGDANENFMQLINKGFIEPANENRGPSVGICRMHPFYRSALVMLAEKAKFLNFDPKGEPTQNFVGSYQACLVGEGLISFEDLRDRKVSVPDLGKLHLLININESVLEFKREWFSKLDNVNVLYLGRWETSATGHREVDDTAFFDELKNIKYVKFLSLQGVSNMIHLPESILNLTNLEILDIRACHNLETIPKEIGRLRSLTYLDMSDCYLLEHMPKSISCLEGLRVLKGFVVVNNPGATQCKLADLAKLKKLVKLCIYTGLREFPKEENVEDLEKLTGLRKLTITWGGSAFKKGDNNETKGDVAAPNNETVLIPFHKGHVEKNKSHNVNEGNAAAGLPVKLEKLDLRYFPTSKTPDWLKVGKLKALKKLYIRGGKFSDLGQYQESDCWDWPLKKDKWSVEVLRLRYLPDLEMEWRQVQELFPLLNYMEQVGCPKLTLFPCDVNGVWMKKKKQK